MPRYSVRFWGIPQNVRSRIATRSLQEQRAECLIQCNPVAIGTDSEPEHAMRPYIADPKGVALRLDQEAKFISLSLFEIVNLTILSPQYWPEWTRWSTSRVVPSGIKTTCASIGRVSYA